MTIRNSQSSSLFWQGARDTFPLVIAAIPFGILFGAIAQSAGMSPWLTMSMSLFVFAGSSQFVAVTLLLASAPVLVVVLATFFVNLRHLMYSSHLVSSVNNLPLYIRTLMSFWLTDETYAVVVRKSRLGERGQPFAFYYLGSALFMYSNWQLCSLIGFYLGEQIPNPLSWGLDIAMVVAFIGVITPFLRGKPQWAVCISAFSISIWTKDWPYQAGLIFSMLSAIAIGLFVSHGLSKRGLKGE